MSIIATMPLFLFVNCSSSLLNSFGNKHITWQECRYNVAATSWPFLGNCIYILYDYCGTFVVVAILCIELKVLVLK